jgi:LysM repeat protein
MKAPAIILSIGTLMLTGCETLQLQTRSDRASLTQDQLIAQESQRRMAGRLETLEMEIDRLGRELDSLRNDLDRRCAAIEQKNKDDKREMIARIGGELDKLVKQVAATPAPAPSGGSAFGFEHIVRPGETLSTIAKAYNVTTKAIIAANRIQNPDRLSVGQKLFIPE